MSVYLNSEVRNSIEQIIEQIELLTNSKKSIKFLCEDNKLKTLKQVLYEKFKNLDNPQKQLSEIVLSYAIQSELLGPGGFEIFFKEFKHEYTLQENVYDNQLVRSNRLTKDILIEFIEQKFSNKVDEFIRNMFIESIFLAGASGKISIEKSASNQNLIEMSNGYNIDVTSMCNLTNSSYINFKSVPIDGYIETVAEANNIFVYANSEKMPIAIFVRGMSDDVLNTISVNNKKGTFIVIPILVPLEINHINTLKDIAIICGTDVVSTHKGELISSIKLEHYPFVEKIDVLRNKIIIKENSTQKQVQNHIKNLIEIRKTKDCSTFDQTVLYDQRIAHLTNRHIICHIKETYDSIYIKTIFDEVLRSISSMMLYGYIKNEKGIFPARTYYGTSKLIKKCVNVIKNIDYVVTLKNENEK